MFKELTFNFAIKYLAIKYLASGFIFHASGSRTTPTEFSPVGERPCALPLVAFCRLRKRECTGAFPYEIDYNKNYENHYATREEDFAGFLFATRIQNKRPLI